MTIRTLFVAAGCLALGAMAASARADDGVKVGVIAPLSGPFAEFGNQMQAGIMIYQQQHGQSVAGKTVTVSYQDSGGANPELAKRLATELVLRDKVQVLAGFGFTPNAMAVAPIATSAKIPMVIMNAAAEALVTKSPYIVRLSFNLPTTVPAMAKYAVAHGAKKIYIITADYAPGHDVEAAAIKAFKQEGAEIVGAVRTPISSFDFSAYMQRVADAKPDALFAFVLGADQNISFMRAYRDKGLPQAGIKLIGTGDITDEPVMDSIGDNGLDTMTTYPYSMNHPSKENEVFVRDFKALRGAAARPNIMAVSGYDGMAAIYGALEKTHGDPDGPAMVEAMKGMALTSPRGPIRIDPTTRDIDQLMYIRRVERTDKGLLINREIDSYPIH